VLAIRNAETSASKEADRIPPAVTQQLAQQPDECEVSVYGVDGDAAGKRPCRL